MDNILYKTLIDKKYKSTIINGLQHQRVASHSILKKRELNQSSSEAMRRISRIDRKGVMID